MKRTLEYAASAVVTTAVLAGCSNEAAPDVRTGLTYAPEGGHSFSIDCVEAMGKASLTGTLVETDPPLTLFAREHGAPDAGVTALYLGNGKLEFITSDMPTSQIVDFAQTPAHSQPIDKGPDTYDLHFSTDQTPTLGSPPTSISIACEPLPPPSPPGGTPKEL